MDFVTISDHNCIRGALEIADLPGTFLSNEVTTYFPENGCKVHVLVIGIDEEQFRMIQELRADIYQLHDTSWARTSSARWRIALFRVNGRLTIDQFERLIAAVPAFRGDQRRARPPQPRTCSAPILGNLTPEMIADMADRQGIEPFGPRALEEERSPAAATTIAGPTRRRPTRRRRWPRTSTNFWPSSAAASTSPTVPAAAAC